MCSGTPCCQSFDPHSPAVLHSRICTSGLPTTSRSMFASDFPVAGLHATFDDVYGVFRNAAASLSLDEQHALFFTTANETYRLGMGEHHV